MLSVKLRIATEDDRSLYKNLFNAYQNELGLYCSEYQDVDCNGYYDAAYTDAFFSGDKSLMPLVIECDERIVGFAVIAVSPYCPDEFDFCIQEFFVVGYYRGKGVADAALDGIFGAMKGKYVAAVLNKNQRAKDFFRRAFAPYSFSEREENGFTLFSADIK
ncbi:MAG: GNAT family N-acetyltransferase [Clostridia bacterium]|nr:GNAT family N-acetyltransferase [Clostridia bacterium]